MKITLILFALLYGASSSALADSLVSVNAVNYPVWMERNGTPLALSPGDDLVPGDVVITGQQGRAWLSMADGSVVKLGESARFTIESAQYDDGPGQAVMTAALNVIKGAFRFTTAFFKPRRQTRHLVHIKVGAITAGLRGTDLWGRSTAEEDFIALLEGSIVIDAEDDDSAILSVPLTRYLKRRGRPASPLDTIDRLKVPALAAETELSESLGIVDGQGAFELVLHSSRVVDGIERAQSRYRAQGYAVRRVPVEVAGETYYRLVVPGLVSLQSARNLSQRMQQEFGLQDIWINNR